VIMAGSHSLFVLSSSTSSTTKKKKTKKIYWMLFWIGAEPNEGVVITRDRNDAANVWELDSPSRWWGERDC
jgi:hypothetical protein